MNRIWVVEMYDKQQRKYLPTTGVGLSQEAASKERQRWMNDCPSDKFRVRKYVREV